MDRLYDSNGLGGYPTDGVLSLRRDQIISSLDVLTPLYAELNTTAFALQEPTTDTESAERLITTDLLLLALDTQRRPVGFATYQFIPSEAGKVIYQARGLAPSARGLGFGKRFPRVAASELGADFLVAKAQNPVSIWSTIATGLFDAVNPIQANFSSSLEMSCVLRDTVTARGKIGQVDMQTGVHKNSYPMGKLGDYNPDFTHVGVAAVQARLRELGVDAANGDAIYYGGKIV